MLSARRINEQAVRKRKKLKKADPDTNVAGMFDQLKRELKRREFDRRVNKLFDDQIKNDRRKQRDRRRT